MYIEGDRLFFGNLPNLDFKTIRQTDRQVKNTPGSWASETAQWAKELAAKPNERSWTPGSPWQKREPAPAGCPLTSSALCSTHAHPSTISTYISEDKTGSLKNPAKQNSQINLTLLKIEGNT